jgi:nucleoside 2-deoxyribosyltransferase
MKIYIAAKYNLRFELKLLAIELEKLGHEITSQWIFGGEEHKGIREAALMDVEDVMRADCLVFIGQPQASENRGGGRWFEFGLAYALKKRCIAVLDMDPTIGGHDHLPLGHESVFTALPEVEIVKNQEELKFLLAHGGEL